MKHVRQRFGMHQPVLDRHVAEGFDRRPGLTLPGLSPKRRVDLLPDAPVIPCNGFNCRPGFRALPWEPAPNGVNSKGKKLVQFWSERFEGGDLPAKQIPVKRFEMTKIEDDPVSLRNRSLV